MTCVVVSPDRAFVKVSVVPSTVYDPTLSRLSNVVTPFLVVRMVECPVNVRSSRNARCLINYFYQSEVVSGDRARQSLTIDANKDIGSK